MGPLISGNPTFSCQAAENVLYLFHEGTLEFQSRLNPSRDLVRRSGPPRREERREKAEREARIVSLLNRGVSIPEIAAEEGLSLKRMRNLVREILAERMPQPPAEFLALQVSRLNEALLVSYGAMHTSTLGPNFEAVDRVVRIVRELDRYHGFAALPRSREETGGAPARRRLSSVRSRSKAQARVNSLIAPQVIEKARFGLANCER